MLWFGGVRGPLLRPSGIVLLLFLGFEKILESKEMRIYMDFFYRKNHMDLYGILFIYRADLMVCVRGQNIQ